MKTAMTPQRGGCDEFPARESAGLAAGGMISGPERLRDERTGTSYWQSERVRSQRAS